MKFSCSYSGEQVCVCVCARRGVSVFVYVELQCFQL